MEEELKESIKVVLRTIVDRIYLGGVTHHKDAEDIMKMIESI